MYWNKQAETMLHDWFDAQQKMTSSWYDMCFGPARNGHSAQAGISPLDLLFPGMLEQWRKLAEQNLSMFHAESANVAKLAAEQFLANQEQMARFMQMVNDAWQTLTNTATSPDEWQKALAVQIDQLRRQLSAFPANTVQTAQNMAELWQLYVQELQKFGQPWFNSWLQTPQYLTKAAGGRFDTPQLVALTNLYWDAFGQTLGRMLGTPSLGLTREFDEKLSKSFALWVDNQRAQTEYSLILGNTWINAFEAFMQKLVAMARAGQQLENQHQLIDLWVEVADTQFIQAFHSDVYAEAQARLVNSGMALRRQQRELTEIWLRMQDLPTRSELDEAHRNIYELRKEVKALKKTVRELSAEAASPAPVPAPKTAHHTPTKTTRRKPKRAAANHATEGVADSAAAAASDDASAAGGE
jgi:class III poly(R)-hydroxyalkanoic acid synthase PhaE subunit